jgi:membrane protein
MWRPWRRRERAAAEPARDAPRGLWSLLGRIKANTGRDNVSLLAAGLALYALLATFPALFASVSLYGIVLDPARIAEQTRGVAAALPAEAAEILQGALTSIAQGQGTTLSVGLAIGVLLALWSARKGMVALMTAMNIVFHLEETRGMVRRMLVSLGLTVGAVVGFLLLVLLGVAAPVIFSVLGIGDAFRVALSALRWLVLWGGVVLGLNIVYRFAPNRADANWRWITYGSASAATLWLVGSVAFSQYVSRFGSYADTYGALAGVVILLLWFYLSGWAVLLGAEIDATLERRDERDENDERPHRGAARPLDHAVAR